MRVNSAKARVRKRWRSSPPILAAVEAALPPADSYGISLHEVHARVRDWDRGYDALRAVIRELIEAGRCVAEGSRGYRLYKLPCLTVREGASSPHVLPPELPEARPQAASGISWAEYGQRSDGIPKPPDWETVEAIMDGVRFEDVKLRAPQAKPVPQESPSVRNVTALICGDPEPGRVRA